MTAPRILLFGKTGQLAREVIAAAQNANIPLRTVSRDEVDFRTAGALARLVAEADADVVVNAVAYTAVDKAESEPELARAINTDAVRELAKACAARNVPLIHVSTDYVFDGTKPSPYTETDFTNPLSAYGRTKLDGERAIQELHSKHVIIRTSWVYSSEGHNFFNTMLRMGAERDILRVVADQRGAPTIASDIARSILEISVQQRETSHSNRFGIFNYSGSGDTSWFEFATAIGEGARQFRAFRAKVEPISTKEYPTPARRPLNSRLDCSKIKAAYGIDAIDWRSGLASVFDILKAKKEVFTS